MSSIAAALGAIESLDSNEKINIAKIAREYGCDRSTLSRHYRGVQVSVTAYHQTGQLLNPQQEKTLVKYIDGLC